MESELLARTIERQGERGMVNRNMVPQYSRNRLLMTTTAHSHRKQGRRIIAHNKGVPQHRTAQVDDVRAHSREQHQLVQNQVLKADRVGHVGVHKLGVDLAASHKVLVRCFGYDKTRREHNLHSRVWIHEMRGARRV